MLFFIVIFFSFVSHVCPMDFHYHSYANMTGILQNLANRYPTKASLKEIGKTTEGRSLWAMALSASQPDQHVLLRPEVKYIGNMHGNEVVGLEILLYLIEYLLTSNDSKVVQLMSSSRIWIMPSMNPDGLAISREGDCSSTDGRYSKLGIDLNRNFPDYYGAELESSTRAIETAGVISWLQQLQFVLSANYHGGDYVINTPLDRYYSGRISTSSDDDIYQLIGHRYIAHTNRSGESCDGSFSGEGHVVRGADWYEIVGGMQDYGYFNYGTIELTMEISCCKYPVTARLIDYWNFNRDAMIDLLLQAQRGVKGRVFNQFNLPITGAEIMINDRRPTVRTTSLGEFWRVLVPGTYILKVLINNAEAYRQSISISDSLVPLQLNINIATSANTSVSSSTPTAVTNTLSSVASSTLINYKSFFLFLSFFLVSV